MSAAGLKVATTTGDGVTTAAVDDANTSNKTKKLNDKTGGLFVNNEEHSCSLRTLPSLKELQSPLQNDLQNNVPSDNSTQLGRNPPENELQVSSRDVSEFSQNYVELGVVNKTTVTQLSPGLNLLQQTAAASSPPPHSYRHSRAYRHFKNPPQPHMCIRTTTDAGEELFINVLSWTRIVIPQEPSDPIPLYGGMRVPPGSPRSPPIVFAVMANPEVLKDSGRHSKDPEERRAMVELMCDFVEAMNPGIKLVRNAVILKDRDISGELKDVWNAVQAQRDREREEQMHLQRQQHFHNITNTPTSGNLITNSSLASINNCSNVTPPTQQMYSKSLSSDTGDNDILDDGGTSPRNKKIIHEVQNDNNLSNKDVEVEVEVTETNNGHVSLDFLADHLDSKMSIVGDEKEKSEESRKKQQNNQNTLTNDALKNENNSENTLERQRTAKTDCGKELNAINCNKDLKKQQPMLANGSIANYKNEDVSSLPKTNVATSTLNAATTIPALHQSTNIAPPPVAQQPPPKKEKLGGFLPNGCIFPRFNKNNKHKDKDKDKEKETKTKDKEKNILLSALKKSKDKKINVSTAAASSPTACNIDEKNTSSNSNTTANHCNQTNTKQQKNCLQQLECGIQKLDLTNNLHNHNLIVENNVNNGTAITNKNTSTTASNAGGVSVH